MKSDGEKINNQFWKFDNQSLEAALSYHRRVTELPFNYEMYDKLLINLLDENLHGSSLNILDAGGGTGKWSIYLAEKGHHVSILDISPAMLEVAKMKVSEAHVEDRIQYLLDDMRNMQIEDNKYDFVISDRNSISFCGKYDDSKAAILECYRVLKSKGTFVGCVHNRYREVSHFISQLDFGKARRLFESGDFEEANKNWLHYFTPTELKETLEEAGFVDINLYPTTIFTEFITTAWLLDQSVLKQLYEFEIQARENNELLSMGVRLHFVATKP